MTLPSGRILCTFDGEWLLAGLWHCGLLLHPDPAVWRHNPSPRDEPVHGALPIYSNMAAEPAVLHQVQAV